jgi:hypothetical protein
VKSLRLEQKPIDSIKQEESAKNPPLEHVCQDEKKGEDAHNVDGGKGHDKLKSRRPKLSFEELLAKYEKIAEANVNNRPKKVSSSKLSPMHKSQEWNWQGDRYHATTTYYPFEQPIPMYYGPQPTYFQPYSPWGWFDEETHLPSYYRPQNIEYAAPRYSEESSYKDRFDQNRSGAQAKKKVVKQVYCVKYDGRKDKSLDLNSTIEKPITLLKNSANDGKEVEKSSIDVVGAKFEQKKMKVPKSKKELPLSKIEVKLTCSIGFTKVARKKLQKLSAEKLREEGFAWVPKGSIQAHKDDAQVSGATKAKERRRFEKQLSSWKFAPDHQSHWSWHQPCSLPMLM